MCSGMDPDSHAHGRFCIRWESEKMGTAGEMSKIMAFLDKSLETKNKG